jgi:hypothetical protein
MSGRRSPYNDDLRLIAATTILILTAQRYFQEICARVSPAGARGAVMADTLGPAVPNTSKEH